MSPLCPFPLEIRKQVIWPKKNWRAENIHYVGVTGWWLKLVIKNKIDLKKKICCKERFYFLINGNSNDFRRKKKIRILEKSEKKQKVLQLVRGGICFNWKIRVLRVTKKEHQIEYDVKLTHWQKTGSKAERSWEDYAKGCKRLERAFDYFYLLIFDSFQKGFKGLPKIATIPKYKLNQWKKKWDIWLECLNLN